MKREHDEEREREQKTLQNDFRQIFDNAAGLRVLQHLQTSFILVPNVPNAGMAGLDLAFQAGRADVVKYIMRQSGAKVEVK